MSMYSKTIRLCCCDITAKFVSRMRKKRLWYNFTMLFNVINSILSSSCSFLILSQVCHMMFSPQFKMKAMSKILLFSTRRQCIMGAQITVMHYVLLGYVHMGRISAAVAPVDLHMAQPHCHKGNPHCVHYFLQIFSTACERGIKYSIHLHQLQYVDVLCQDLGENLACVNIALDHMSDRGVEISCGRFLMITSSIEMKKGIFYMAILQLHLNICIMAAQTSNGSIELPFNYHRSKQ